MCKWDGRTGRFLFFNVKSQKKTSLFLAVRKVDGDNLIITGCRDCLALVLNAHVFVFMPRSPPLSSPAAFIRPAARIARFLKCVAVDSRETARWVLQVTRRDVISNRCHAFICSAGAWRGRGLWADPLGLWSVQPPMRRGRAADWESHSSVYRVREAPVS